MTYVFDTSSLQELFRYPRSRFPTLWKRFESVVQESKLMSVREVLREIERQDNTTLKGWAKENKNLFPPATEEETEKVKEIFQNEHFQGLIKETTILKGGPAADPFIIAKGAVMELTVITQEKLKENASKIPNVCKFFNVDCTNLEGFMTHENWVF